MEQRKKGKTTFGNEIDQFHKNQEICANRQINQDACSIS